MSSGEWTAVGVAGGLASVILGVLLTRPVWEQPGKGPRFVPALLAVHAGAAVIVGVVATGAAIRSWQIVDRAEPVRGLLGVSQGEGDGSLYGLLVLALAALTAVVTVLLTVASRFAASTHPVDRAIACAVIVLEIGVSGVGLAYLTAGSRAPVTLLSVAHLPILVAGLVACWPRAVTTRRALLGRT